MHIFIIYHNVTTKRMLKTLSRNPSWHRPTSVVSWSRWRDCEKPRCLMPVRTRDLENGNVRKQWIDVVVHYWWFTLSQLVVFGHTSINEACLSAPRPHTNTIRVDVALSSTSHTPANHALHAHTQTHTRKHIKASSQSPPLPNKSIFQHISTECNKQSCFYADRT